MGLLDRIFTTLGLRSTPPEPADDAAKTDAADAKSSDEAAKSSSPLENLDELTPTEPGERDPELEAKDDPGTFEFATDIARYFTAEFRIEQAWRNKERREKLFGEYSIRDTAHWFQIQATFQRWLKSDEGRAKYPTDAALSQARMTTTQTVSMDELNLLVAEAKAAKAERED